MAHAPTADRKLYLQVFFALIALTLLEVVIALPWVKDAVGTTLVAVGLVGMALGKAGMVMFIYMHLGHETKALKNTVVLPFLAPALYAFVLIGEAAWRLSAAQLQGVFPKGLLE